MIANALRIIEKKKFDSPKSWHFLRRRLSVSSYDNCSEKSDEDEDEGEKGSD